MFPTLQQHAFSVVVQHCAAKRRAQRSAGGTERAALHSRERDSHLTHF